MSVQDPTLANFLPRVRVVQTRTVYIRAGYVAALGFFIAASALAQPAPSPGETSRPPQWTVAAGVESLWWRDVARTGPPVLASPISWEGQGPAVYGSYDRGRRSRLHHFEGAFASAGGFELRSPVRTTAGPEDDGAWRVGVRYEYRRYPWQDLWMMGFDVGIGVEGSGEYPILRPSLRARHRAADGSDQSRHGGSDCRALAAVGAMVCRRSVG